MNITGNINALRAIVRRGLMRTFRIWPQTIFPPLITTTLYFIIFGKLLGARFGHIAGFSYLQFIVPGIIMMSILNSAFMATSTVVFISKFQRNIEELLVSPACDHVILVGLMSDGVCRGTLIGCLVALVARFFTHLPMSHPILLVVSGILASSLLSLLGVINGILADTFDDISWIPTFLLTPLTYLGGVFYSLNVLPVLWQKISLFNPIFYVIDVFRYSVLNIHTIDTGITLATILALCAILYGYAYYLLRASRRLRP